MIKSDTIYIKTILLLSQENFLKFYQKSSHFLAESIKPEEIKKARTLNTPYVYNMKLDKSTQQTVKLGTRLYCTKFLLNQTTI